MQNIHEHIHQSVSSLMTHTGFPGWIKDQSLSENDIILINNSFIYRNVKTVKSDKYLALRVNSDGKVNDAPNIATGMGINADFKLIAGKSKNLPVLIPIDTAVKEEISRLGSMVFILIGKIEDTVVIKRKINHSAFDSIVWNPAKSDTVYIENSSIVVNDTQDEESVWEGISVYFKNRDEAIPDGLRDAVGVALDTLQDDAVAKLEIPSKLTPSYNGMTDDIVKVLTEHRTQYQKSLTECGGDPARSATAFNEILRIAYNFASDAITYLRLVVSICDLKPIILWGTIFEHFKLSEAFKSLPWHRSKNKPSLQNYISTIADSRNSAFHNLFPFRKTLKLSLPKSALQDANLIIFSEHGKKKDNQLLYPDKELVDILTEFTRARERHVSPRFWQQNLEIMNAAIDLFDKTSEFLKKLHGEMSW